MSVLMFKPLPSRDTLLEHLTYDPGTGELRWRKRGQGRALGVINSRTKAGYVQVQLFGQNYKAHRIIWCMVTGVDPGPDEIDHRNGKRHENWWGNLRLASRSEQVINSAVSTRNSTGVRGVWRIKSRSLYGAKISAEKRGYFLGEYTTLQDAAAVRLTAELIVHGEFAREHAEDIATALGIRLLDPNSITARPSAGPERLQAPRRLVDLWQERNTSPTPVPAAEPSPLPAT